ncbi:MAG: RND transporter [Candidatus Binatia bacterium]|nr:MAG: RND transporter [Candidatus Binatia bacterium]
MSGTRLRWAWALLVVCDLLLLGEVQPSAAQANVDYGNEQSLAELLWERAAEVIEARAAIRQGESAYERARLYPNPTLDAAWSTIPVGRTNPPGLSDRLDRIPNYSASLSELFEIGKRGPRIAARSFDVQRLRAEAEAILGDRFFALLEAIGQIAANQRRRDVLDEQLRDGEELLELDRARASRGEIPALDVDVAEVEQARLRALRDSAEADLRRAQADCSRLLALTCPEFQTDDAAGDFLARVYRPAAASRYPVEAALERRPDVRALRLAISAAAQDAQLAARRVVPDVTVRAGYTYDPFVVSGNQRNSLALGVEVPIPAFDRGQADLLAARAAESRAREALRVLVEGLPAQLQVAQAQLELALRRMNELDRAIAKARTMRDALVEAQHAGGISAIEVLVARRNYQDLLRERVGADADAFSAAVNIRKLTGVFPTVPKKE